VSGDGTRGQTTVVELTAAQRAVARRAAESRATVPQLELSMAREPGDELPTALVVRACALSLAEHPQANAAYRDGRFELYSRVNVGVVMALEETYLIPTVFDADRKGLRELRAEIDELRVRALRGQLTPPAFSGTTFTVWNASQLGIAQASLPVVPPQAAGLTAGTSMLTLACDHRILYGAAAVGFLAAVSRRLAEEAG
jgi:pyruvate dehydrogenase E2 component (dihydrolipoamide acetyltransferase)